MGVTPRTSLWIILAVLPAITIAASAAVAQPPGPPVVWQVEVVGGEVEIADLPPVELADGASVRVNNEASDPVPVTSVDADRVLPAELLPPGGRTIGGPGFFDAPLGDDQLILAGFRDAEPVLMCYTFINLGPGSFSIIGTGHPAGDFQDVMQPDEQETHCGRVSAITIECEFSEQPCSGIYRVDLVE